MDEQFNPATPPSGSGCVECLRDGSWWLHLRRCAACGHIGCCDSSLGKHASLHFALTGHRFVQSFEPNEDWWWDYRDQVDLTGPPLAPPTHHPEGQPVPGPEGLVPADWEALLAAQDGS